MRHPAGLSRCGLVRPALPLTLYADDFSIIVRLPIRLRIVRGRIILLH